MQSSKFNTKYTTPQPELLYSEKKAYESQEQIQQNELAKSKKMGVHKKKNQNKSKDFKKSLQIKDPMTIRDIYKMSGSQTVKGQGNKRLMAEIKNYSLRELLTAKKHSIPDKPSYGTEQKKKEEGANQREKEDIVLPIITNK